MTTPSPSRKPYPTDVSDDEWAFVAPYLALLDEEALQRRYPLREVFNAVRWIVRAGAPWHLLPTNLPPWPTV
jgi:transposase